MVEQRNAAGAVVKEYFDQGFLNGTTAYYYGEDHLGSIRNLSDASGTIQAQLDYGPYGEVTEVNGQTQPDFAYTGLFYHQRSGLHFAEYRAYDTGVKRWLNRDVIAETGGINLYAYVGGNPLAWQDFQGTSWGTAGGPFKRIYPPPGKIPPPRIPGRKYTCGGNSTKPTGKQKPQ